MLKYAELAKSGKTGWEDYINSILLMLFFWLVLGVTVAVVIIKTSGITPFTSNAIIFLEKLFLLLGLFLSVKYIHKRWFVTLITPSEKINWGKFSYGFITFFLLLVIFTIIEYFVHPTDFKFTFNSSIFFSTLPIIVLSIILMATTEELFFRGYTIQLFGLFVRNDILLGIISGIIFTIPHLWNPEILNGFYIMVITYFVYGLMFALITLKSNSLEIAIGAHVANNLFCALFVNYENSVLKTNSIFTITNVLPLFSLIVLAITAVIFYYLVLKYTINNTKKTPLIISENLESYSKL